MADKDGDGPSLKLPSLGFGRKRGKKAKGAQDDAPVAPDPAPVAPEPAPLAPELAADPTPAEAPPEPEPEPEPVRSPEAEAETETETETETQPTARAEAGRPTAYLPPVPPPEPTAPPLFADEVQDSPTRTDAPPVAAEPDAPSEPKAPKPKRQFKLPAISPMAAALLTGAVVGLLMVGLTGAGFRFCELVQGAPSCGDPGFLLLLAIVIIVILVGKALLDAWDLPDPGSTSFLAVGLLSVVALLFLVDVLFNWWMIIVIPVLAMLCFALSHWVTTAFADDE